MDDITVCIPSIPPRASLLARAVTSAASQTKQAAAISVAIDHLKEGAGPTRTRALMAAQTEWVAFLDDDDEFYRHHLELLINHALETGADVVWGWYDVHGGTDPLPAFEGRQWDPSDPHLFPITALVRTELAKETGGFTERHPSNEISGEDFPFWLKCDELGGRFSHVLKRTWVWHHDSHNTSGLPTRW